MEKKETLKEKTLYEVFCELRDSVVKTIFTVFL
jgi:hypothetical protein